MGEPELQLLMQGEISRRAERRRVEAISQAMATGARVQRRRPTIGDVDAMGGVEFEHFLGSLFRAMGYQVQVTQASGDQGADLVLEKFGDRTVVQAKRYSATVSNSAVQEAVAAKAHYRSRHALVVTSSSFTTSALALAASNGVDLWDRGRLESMISTYL
jgi:restriction system protein